MKLFIFNMILTVGLAVGYVNLNNEIKTLHKLNAMADTQMETVIQILKAQNVELVNLKRGKK